MYCPQCGQKQVSDDVRFCSRCGFPLAGVLELLTSGGVLPVRLAEGQETDLSPRRKGVRQGVMMMLMGAVIVPILAVLDSFEHGPSTLDRLVPLAAILFFAGGLMRIIYAIVFEQNTARSQALPANISPAMPSQLNAGMRAGALPPPQSTPVPVFRPQAGNTAELVPPSVTENTTRLLDETEAPRRQ
ncbi:MAG TPA: zinc ribbon domain-containing protein [Pyrinomonadaceae bacterium]|jgi:hypothetical protein